MGEFGLGTWLKRIGWLATVTMLFAAIGMFATWGVLKRDGRSAFSPSCMASPHRHGFKWYLAHSGRAI
jgi:hypothetical protein